jgi:hypothetical protein
MGQSEFTRRMSHAFPSASTLGPLAGLTLAVHHLDAEPSPAAATGDAGEHPLPGWEAAWIDLGGEG